MSAKATAPVGTADRLDFLDLLAGPPACAGREAVFTAETPTPRELQVTQALCALCPAQEPCRAYARRQRLHYIWGGESTRDRARAGYNPYRTR